VSQDSRDTNDDILKLSDDQVKLFERRYREGYDLPDPVYFKWLRINHPTVENQITSFDETSVIQEQPSQQHCDENQFRDSCSGECTENISLLELISANETSENLCLECPIVEPVTATNREDMDSNDRPAHLPSNAATNRPVVEPPDHKEKLNYISKYLVQYVPLKKASNSATQRTTGARVLTSEECSKYIFEQEEKKRKEKEQYDFHFQGFFLFVCFFHLHNVNSLTMH